MAFGDGDLPFTISEDAHCVGATYGALKVVIDDDKTIWAPRSVVHDDSEVWKVDDKGAFVVKQWWAEQHGYC